MRDSFKKSFKNELKEAQSDLVKVNSEIIALRKKKTELENRIKDINNILVISNTPLEGDSVSYKLGNTILKSNSFKNIFNLPLNLFSIYKYNKLVAAKKLETKKNIKEQPQEKPKIELIQNKSISENSIVISLLDKNNNEVIERTYQNYSLIGSYEKQIKNSKASKFVLESCWESREEFWNYSLVSKNFSNYQATKLLAALQMLIDKNIPIYFIYKNEQKYFHLFEKILDHVDKVITNNFSVYEDLKKKKFQKVSFFLGASNTYIFNSKDSLTHEERSGVAFFYDYGKSFVDDLEQKNNLLLDSIAHNINILKKPTSYLESNQNIIEFDHSGRANIIKKHKFILNLIEGNEKIIPQVVLDSLASGIPVISNYSKFLDDNFSGIIQFVNSSTEFDELIEKYKNNKWDYLRLSHLGYRVVVNDYNHTQFKDFIANNGNDEKKKEEPLVSIIMATMREKYIDRVLLNLSRQNYANKEIIFVTQNFTADAIKKLKTGLLNLKGFVKTLVVEENSSLTLGERLNLAASHAKGVFIAKMDDDDFYFENYLTDMMLPFKCGNYSVVGKAENFVYLEGLNQTVLLRENRAANREKEFVAGPTIVIKKSVFDKLNGFLALNRGEDSTLIKRVLESGDKVYSADPFNFIQFRSSDVTAHTWQQKVDAFAKSGTYVADGMAEDIVRL